MSIQDLKRRRVAVERARASWSGVAHQSALPANLIGVVSRDIIGSWSRSANHVADEVTAAPLDNPERTRSEFEQSPLHVAVGAIETELRKAAEDGDLVVAVTDSNTRILWTYGGRVMRRKAEQVNFVPGGRWDEDSVGTNALSLAQQAGATRTVFSAEHYAPIVHNWVCWAAPVRDPHTGIQLGVLDLSTTWDRAHPIGSATASLLASLLEREIPLSRESVMATTAPHHGLELRLLGAVEAWLDGRRLPLTRRQSEIVALLSLNSDGMSLGGLHAALYGDAPVSRSTLKAEVSHLRQALGGRLASRPYRLDLPVRSDVSTVIDAVRVGDVLTAVRSYRGDLIPGSNSPELVSTGEYLAVAVRELVLATAHPEAAVAYAERAPWDREVIDRALHVMGARPHPLRAELLARRACRP